MRLIFAFINQMRLNGGPPKYIADEKRQMRDIDFQFLQRGSALSTAKSKSSSLGSWDDGEGTKDCQIDELLYKHYANRHWRPDDINRYLEMLTPSNCYVTFTTKLNSNEADLQTEPIYDTKFKKEPISDELIATLATALPKPDETLGYPPPNPYVP